MLLVCGIVGWRVRLCLLFLLFVVVAMIDCSLALLLCLVVVGCWLLVSLLVWLTFVVSVNVRCL